MPEKKSKDELIKRIDALEADRDKARGLLYEVVMPKIAIQLDSHLLSCVNVFLAETSTVKS